MKPFSMRTKHRTLQNDDGIRPRFLILHGFTGGANTDFLPWLKNELTKRGFEVDVPVLPNTDNPIEREQVNYVLMNCRVDENTVLIGHSLGAIVAMKVLARHNKPIAGTVLVAAAMDPQSAETLRPYHKNFDWNIDYGLVKRLSGFVLVFSDLQEDHRVAYLERIARQLDAKLVTATANNVHFTAKKEPVILAHLIAHITHSASREET